MSELLSNEEIDTLLELFRAEGGELSQDEECDLRRLSDEEEEAVPPDVKSLDLLRPNRFGHDQLLGLERRFLTAANSMAATLCSRLRLDMRCDCLVVEEMRFSNWSAQFKSQAAFFLLRFEPFVSPVLVTVSNTLMYGIVDRLLGGSGAVVEDPDTLTAAEFEIADAVVAPLIEDVVASMRDFARFDWQLESRSNSFALAQIVSANDVVLTVCFRVTGRELLGDVQLVLPFGQIEPHLDRLVGGDSGDYSARPGSRRADVARAIGGSQLDLTVELGRVCVPLRRLMNLRQGDVITLPTRVGDSLTARVAGTEKFVGQLGTRGSRLAFRVAANISREEHDGDPQEE